MATELIQVPVLFPHSSFFAPSFNSKESYDIDRPQFYSPTLFGNRLGIKGRYELVRMLAWTEKFTVWLAIDTKTDPGPKAYVAIKIMIRFFSLWSSAEHEPFAAIVSFNPCHPGFQHCLALRDHFYTPGQLDHICFVTDVLGPSLKILRPPGQSTFTIPIAKRIIKQLLLALSYIHECGYIHGDVKSDNILVRLPEMFSAQIEDHLQANPTLTYNPAFEKEQSSEILACPPDLCISFALEDISICLINYDQATRVDDKAMEQDRWRRTFRMDINTSFFRAPEAILDGRWSPSIDTWAVGHFLFEIITNRTLFDQISCSTNYVLLQKMALQKMVEYLGPFPRQFVRRCDWGATFFDIGGNVVGATNLKPNSIHLEDVLYDAKVNGEDVPGAAAFIRRCHTLDPALRPAAQELLHDAWLESV